MNAETLLLVLLHSADNISVHTPHLCTEPPIALLVNDTVLLYLPADLNRNMAAAVLHEQSL